MQKFWVSNNAIPLSPLPQSTSRSPHLGVLASSGSDVRLTIRDVTIIPSKDAANCRAVDKAPDTYVFEESTVRSQPMGIKKP